MHLCLCIGVIRGYPRIPGGRASGSRGGQIFATDMVIRAGGLCRHRLDIWRNLRLGPLAGAHHGRRRRRAIMALSAVDHYLPGRPARITLSAGGGWVMPVPGGGPAGAAGVRCDRLSFQGKGAGTPNGVGDPAFAARGSLSA